MSKESRQSNQLYNSQKIISRRSFLISEIGAGILFFGGVTDGYLNFRSMRKAESEAEIDAKRAGMAPLPVEAVSRAERMLQSQSDRSRDVNRSEIEQAQKVLEARDRFQQVVRQHLEQQAPTAERIFVDTAAITLGIGVAVPVAVLARPEKAPKSKG